MRSQSQKVVEQAFNPFQTLNWCAMMVCGHITRDVQNFRRGPNIMYSYHQIKKKIDNKLDKITKRLQKQGIAPVSFYLISLGHSLILNYINKILPKSCCRENKQRLLSFYLRRI